MTAVNIAGLTPGTAIAGGHCELVCDFNGYLSGSVSDPTINDTVDGCVIGDCSV